MPALPRGVVAPILTPFNPDLTVATDLFAALAHRLLDDGCVALAPFGTTGEALSVGVDERLSALDALVQAGIPPTRLVPGTGLTDLPGTAHLTRRAVDLGCAGAMALPPFYYKDITDDGLYAYFARLIDRVGRDGLRLYLYHIPQVAGVGVPVDVVARLRADFPDQVVGIKDSSGDWSNTRALFRIPGLTVYPGSELPLLDALAQGGPGCISATANVNAAAIARTIGLYDAGQADAAAAHHETVRRFRLAVQAASPIPAQKWLWARATGDARWAVVRPPLQPLADADGQALAGLLAREHGFRLEARAGIEPAFTDLQSGA